MMAFKDLFKKKEVRADSANSAPSILGGYLAYNCMSSYQQNQAMLLSTVYRCVDLLSNSISELPVVVNKVNSDGYKVNDSSHIVFSLLNKKPSNRMNKNTFLRLLVINMLLTGNAYAYIKRDNQGQIKELQFIPSDYVNIHSRHILDDVTYTINGIKGVIESKDLLHFINIPDHDGIRGLSVLSYARKTLTLGFDEISSADAFFRSGNNKSGILKSDRPITEEQEQQILSRWQQTFGTSNGVNTSGVVVLKPGLEYQDIQTSPADAELLESRKFTVLEICRFFGCAPSMVFDNSNNSYSSVEAENLAFLTHTISPLLDKIETELNNKLWSEAEAIQGYQVRFDTSVLMRTDKQALASYYSSMFNLGVLSPNEIRRELDMSPIEGGDEHYMQVNISTISKIAGQDLQSNENISNQLKTDEKDR